MPLKKFLSLSLGAVSAIAATARASGGFPSQQLQQVLQQSPSSSYESESLGVLRRFTPDSTSSVESILGIAQDHDLDIWQITNSHIDVYFPPPSPVPHALSLVNHTTSYIPTQHQTTSSNSRPLQSEWNLNSLSNSTFHSTYHPLFEVDSFLNELVEMRPDMVKLIKLGHSGQGREMMGVTISTEFGVSSSGDLGRRKGKGRKGHEKEEDVQPKLGFVITGAQHAREWVATAAALHLAHALVVNASEPRSLSPLLRNFEFHIIPVPNPDGYDYTWENDRYWYKNRQVMGPARKCIGLDMNRFGYKWEPTVPENTPPQLDEDLEELREHSEESLGKKKKKQRTPVDPCSHWYPGHRPFEAPEVNNLANFVTTLPNLVGFVDLRSYGQMLSTPYSYSCKRIAKDAEDQIEAAMGAIQALKQTHGTPFMLGSLCSMLYRAPGNILDWMYARAGIKYSYAVHLRDTGTYGFSLPAEMIRPVGEETGEMVKYLAKFVAKKLGREFLSLFFRVISMGGLADASFLLLGEL
ncbi:hypothetical protein BDN72DRAFT_770233 [Pluteus cervinus]|uniref:Uncharacterized protein n=1 Tax=Pluteus cervinus TaxID=181527 RepID=A0ACD3AQ44_9AGAR|nr:hypothetical protein BDN72DRAFT_770233 [Pluteus cervinus]